MHKKLISINSQFFFFFNSFRFFFFQTFFFNVKFFNKCLRSLYLSSQAKTNRRELKAPTVYFYLNNREKIFIFGRNKFFLTRHLLTFDWDLFYIFVSISNFEFRRLKKCLNRCSGDSACRVRLLKRSWVERELRCQDGKREKE